MRAMVRRRWQRDEAHSQQAERTRARMAALTDEQRRELGARLAEARRLARARREAAEARQAQ